MARLRNGAKMAAFRDAWPQFTALADALGGTYQYLASGELKYFQHFDVVEAGVPVRVQLAVGNKGGITDIFLSARLRALVISTEVVVRQEHALDRLGKRLGIDREVQTGDAAFDAAVYIESDAADADVLRLFADARVRSTLMASTQFPSSHLAFAADEPMAEDRRTTPVRLRLPPDAVDDVARMREAITTLASVVDAFASGQGASGAYRDVLPAKEVPARPVRKGRGILAVLFVFGTFFGHCAMPDAPPTFGHVATLLGLALGGILWALLLVPFGLMFRGRSSSFSTVIALMLGSLAVVPLGMRTVQHANAAFDVGPPAPHVGRARYVRRKGGDRVEITATWLPSAPTVLAAADPMPLKPDEDDVAVDVVVRPGLFGAPWLNAVRRHTDAK